MKKLKSIFSNHATERFFERTYTTITRKDIIIAIENKQKKPFKKLSASRTMTYIMVKNEIIKAIMNRLTGRIITILPWKSIYSFRIKLRILQYDNRIYAAHIYPDCFMETNKSHSLTKIYECVGFNKEWNTDEMVEIRYNHPYFEPIFGKAWSMLQSDDDHRYIDRERFKGNETFNVKNKTKTFESIIQVGMQLPSEEFITGR